MNLDSLYQEIILDHYKKPAGNGLQELFTGEAFHVNTSCGDEVKVRVLVTDDHIENMTHEGIGCSISRASASILHGLVVGETVPKYNSLLNEFVDLMHSQGKIEPNEDVLGDAAAFAGVSKYPARVKCALLPWMALKDAIEGEQNE
jgi:nitrogen fixation protein NifU and related proteins